MKICISCNSQVNDSLLICPNCHADLTVFSVNEKNLVILKENPRVKAIRVVVSNDSCPACQSQEGSYAKENVPSLPVDGCSGPLGCRCTYKPVLDEIFP